MNDKRTRPLQLDEPIVTGNMKAAAREAGATSGDLWKVPYDQIHYDPRDNVRPLDIEHAKHIGKLIAQNGYDWSQPLHCYVRKVGDKNLYYVTKGQHRYHGAGFAIKAGIDVGPIPVVVIDAKKVNRVDMIFSGLTSNDSKRTSPLELAEKIAELRDVHGIDVKTICRRLNITEQTVRDVALLEAAPSALHKLVREGTVAGTLAIEEIRKHGADKALDRLQKGAVEAKATGKAKVTKKHLAKPDAAPAPKKITEPQAKLLLQALQAVLHDSGFGDLSPGARDAVHTALGPLVDLLDAKPAPKAWPVTEPDAGGLCDALDVIEFSLGADGKVVAQIRTAQPGPGVWIHSVMYNTGHSFASGPLKIFRNTRASWTRAQAIRAGASELIGMLTGGKRSTKTEQAAGEKIIAWAKSLLNQSDPDWTKEMTLAMMQNHTPDLTSLLATIETEARTARNRELLESSFPSTGSKSTARATTDAWPFPSGARPTDVAVRPAKGYPSKRSAK